MSLEASNIRPETSSEVAEKTKEQIELERSGVQTGLMTRWVKLNRAFLKYLRFETIYTLAGASGSGKSYIANMIRSDFTDIEDIVLHKSKFSPAIIEHLLTKGEFIEESSYIVRLALNRDLPFVPLFIHYSYEMNPHKEMTRTIATMTGYSYAYLLSSEVVGMKGHDYIYNVVSDEEKFMVDTLLDEIGRKTNVFSFSKALTLREMYETVYTITNAYTYSTRYGKPIKVIVSLDHTLLSAQEGPTDDQILQDDTIRTLIKIRQDFGCMILPIVQLNSGLEDDKRRMNKNLHYPTKKDLYRGGQLYQGSDYIIVFQMPSKVGIGLYGPDEIPTQNLIHGSIIKGRDGIDGQIWFNNQLHQGRIVCSDFDKETRVITHIPNLNKK